MTSAADVVDTPSIPISIAVDLPREVSPLQVAQVVDARMAGLLQTLGVPGTPHTTVEPVDSASPPDGRLPKVQIHGETCRYPSELLHRVKASVVGRPPSGETGAEWVQHWLRGRQGSDGSTASARDVEEFVALFCLEVVQAQPSRLVATDQAHAYASALARTASPPAEAAALDVDWLADVLRHVVDLGTSVADVEAVSRVLVESEGRLPRDAAEAVVAGRRRATLDIHVTVAYLRELTSAEQPEGSFLFASLRDQFFDELGISAPPFRFVLDEGVGENRFAFRLNELVTMPTPGLRPGECLVSEDAETLQVLEIPAEPTLDPLTGVPASIIPAESKAEADSFHLTTWTPLEYLALALQRALRTYAPRLVDRRTIEGDLSALWYPDLAAAVRASVPINVVVRACRRLVGEGVSIQNLKRILDLFVDYTAEDDAGERASRLRGGWGSDAALLQDREEADLLGYLRRGLARQVRASAAQGQEKDTIGAYLLDEDVDELVARYTAGRRSGNGGASGVDAAEDSVAAQLREELGHGPLAVPVPALLTRGELRTYLRELVSSEFPSVPVLAFEELLPDTKVRRLGRIGAERAAPTAMVGAESAAPARLGSERAAPARAPERRRGDSMLRVHMLPAGNGDALWIEYGDEASPRRILIDGGTKGSWTDGLRSKIEALPGDRRHFELLVVTHVDADHIEGALALLQDDSLGVTFGDVWFNGWRHLPDTDMLGPVEGELLTDAIVSQGLPWNAAFGEGAVAVQEDGPLPRARLDGELALTVLAPRAAELAALKPVWRKAVQAAGLDPDRPRAETKEEAEPPGLELLGAAPVPEQLPDVAALAALRFTSDTAEPNGSSIVLLLEHDGRSVLLTGDAFPSVVLASLQRLGAERGGRLTLDALKLPHHGSRFNVSAELLRAADCRRFLFSSNGSRTKHPHAEAVARVLVAAAGDAELVFNYRTAYTELWDEDRLRAQNGYRTVFPDSGSGGLSARI